MNLEIKVEMHKKLPKIEDGHWWAVEEILSYFLEFETDRVRVSKEEAVLIEKYMPYVKVEELDYSYIERPYLIIKISEIPLEHQVLYYQKKYKEMTNKYSKALSLAEKIVYDD